MSQFDPSDNGAAAPRDGAKYPRPVLGYEYGPVEWETMNDGARREPCVADVRFVTSAEHYGHFAPSLCALRSPFWNDRFAQVSAQDISLGCFTTPDSAETGCGTLADYLRLYFPAADGQQEEREDASEVICQVRYQAVFLPEAQQERNSTMEVHRMARYSDHEGDKPLFLCVQSEKGPSLLPSSHELSYSFASPGVPLVSDLHPNAEDTNARSGANRLGPLAVQRMGGSVQPEAVRMLIQLPLRQQEVASDAAANDGSAGKEDEEASPSEQTKAAESRQLSRTESESSWEEFPDDLAGKHEEEVSSEVLPPTNVTAFRKAADTTPIPANTTPTPANTHDGKVNTPPGSTRFTTLDSGRQVFVTVTLFFPLSVPAERVASLLDDLYLGRTCCNNNDTTPSDGCPREVTVQVGLPPSSSPRHTDPTVTTEPMPATCAFDAAAEVAWRLLCSKGHPLTPPLNKSSLARRRTICDHCRANMRETSTWFACRECNLDICSTCYTAAVAAAEELKQACDPFGADTYDGVVLPAKCLREHALTNLFDSLDVSRPFPGRRFICDVCRTFIDRSTNGFCCRPCNYDICGECHRKSTVSLRRRDAAAAPATGPVTPRASAPSDTTTTAPVSITASSTRAPTTVVVNCHNTCPGRHGLTRVDTNETTSLPDHYMCNVCKSFISTQDGRYYCRACDYDLCNRCYLKAPSCDNHPLQQRTVQGTEECTRCHKVVSGADAQVYDCTCRQRGKNPHHPPRVLCECCFMAALQ